MNFSGWLLNREINSPGILEQILFTDEAAFNREHLFITGIVTCGLRTIPQDSPA